MVGNGDGGQGQSEGGKTEGSRAGLENPGSSSQLPQAVELGLNSICTKG